jgi:hypothetical protein
VRIVSEAKLRALLGALPSWHPKADGLREAGRELGFRV